MSVLVISRNSSQKAREFKSEIKMEAVQVFKSRQPRFQKLENVSRVKSYDPIFILVNLVLTL